MYRRYFKVLTDYEPPGKTVPWKGPKRKDKTRRRRSKLFDKEPDISEDGEGGAFNYISGVLKSSNNNDVGGGWGRDETGDYIPLTNQRGGNNVPLGYDDRRGVRFEEGKNGSTNVPITKRLNPIIAVEEVDAPITKYTEGRRFIQRHMLKFIEADCIPPSIRKQLIDDSVNDPQVLIGWQVRGK